MPDHGLAVDENHVPAVERRRALAYRQKLGACEAEQHENEQFRKQPVHSSSSVNGFCRGRVWMQTALQEPGQGTGPGPDSKRPSVPAPGASSQAMLRPVQRGMPMPNDSVGGRPRAIKAHRRAHATWAGAAGMLAALMLAATSAAAADGVRVDDQGGGRYSLTTTLVDTTDPAHGQLAIVPKAEELCEIGRA